MKVIVASTSLHLINALILKYQFKEKFFLVYIGKENYIFNKIKKEFEYLHLNEEKKDFFKKINLRIENSKKLLEVIKILNPEEIIVGNDRKIETSILIANYKANYSYLDDGLHSYIPEKQHIFKYTFFEKKLKEIIYRNKLILPKFIGKGNYIKKAYLFKPEFANDYLKQKELIKLQPKIHKLQEIFKENIDSKKILLLPHPKFIDNSKLQCIKKFIDNDTLVKLHPRDNTTKLTAKTINLPAEVIFLNLSNSEILGFNTTALLMAKWLNSDLEVKMIKFNYSLNDIERFMVKNDIKEIYCK